MFFRLPSSSSPQPLPRLSPAAPRLASVRELESERFQMFMRACNAFAAKYELRQFTNWSKVWEYPWLFSHGLDQIDWRGKRVLDFGSEISPMPWLLAALGAAVTLIETDAQWVPRWEKLRAELGVNLDWKLVSDEALPIADASIDVVTSFSVIEHQPDKVKAASEIGRVLKAGSPAFISFDICEPDLGMTFPEWNGRAMTMAEFERELWCHPAFANADAAKSIQWNLDDIPAFKAWHLQSAAHHNYVTGAAVLVKK
jgi:SAM-dependent methyltransferase